MMAPYWELNIKEVGGGEVSFLGGIRALGDSRGELSKVFRYCLGPVDSVAAKILRRTLSL